MYSNLSNGQFQQCKNCDYCCTNLIVERLEKKARHSSKVFTNWQTKGNHWDINKHVTWSELYVRISLVALWRNNWTREKPKGKEITRKAQLRLVCTVSAAVEWRGKLQSIWSVVNLSQNPREKTSQAWVKRRTVILHRRNTRGARKKCSVWRCCGALSRDSSGLLRVRARNQKKSRG